MVPRDRPKLFLSLTSSSSLPSPSSPNSPDSDVSRCTNATAESSATSLPSVEDVNTRDHKAPSSKTSPASTSQLLTLIPATLQRRFRRRPSPDCPSVVSSSRAVKKEKKGKRKTPSAPPSLRIDTGTSAMASTTGARASARTFFRDHHPHLPRSGKSSDKQQKVDDKDPQYQQKKDEEKHMICAFEEKNSKAPLSPNMVMKDPSEKHVGYKSKYLKRSDFKMIKTIGTGTFARVDLVRLDVASNGDEKKVFALKRLRKVDVIKLKQIEHVKSERDVLAAVAGHPFITTMVASFSDHDCVYMILDYCPGGEIFTYLRHYKNFEDATAQFYAAEVVLILEFLHEKKSVAYRDLKPENILIDADGHLKLVDFGFAKKLDGKQTWTLCGTPEYLAPETIRNTGHGPAVDWWALGILIYEFLIGQPPFWDNNPMKLYEKVCAGKVSYPASPSVSSDAKDVISKLCTANPAQRLGNLSGQSQDVKDHPWFKDIDWQSIYKREKKGPIIPELRSKDDTRNFENYDAEPERRTVYTPDQYKKYDHEFNGF